MVKLFWFKKVVGGGCVACASVCGLASHVCDKGDRSDGFCVYALDVIHKENMPRRHIERYDY